MRLCEEKERCWTGLRCLTLICIFYDAPSCQNTRSHTAVPLAPSLLLCVCPPLPSHHVYMNIFALLPTVTVTTACVQADYMTLRSVISLVESSCCSRIIIR